MPDDVKELIENCRDEFFVNLFELKEGPPLRIRATWGHSIPVPNVTVRNNFLCGICHY